MAARLELIIDATKAVQGAALFNRAAESTAQAAVRAANQIVAAYQRVQSAQNRVNAFGFGGGAGGGGVNPVSPAINPTNIARTTTAIQRLGQTGQTAARTLGSAFATAGRSISSVFLSTIRSGEGLLRTIFNIRTVLLTLGVGFLVGGVIQYADAWQNAENRLRPFTESLEKARLIQDEIFRSAQRTRQPLGESVNLASRILLNQDNLGIDTATILRLVETVNIGLALSGSTTAEAQGATRQLSQLLGGQVVRGAGQEINSLAENAIRLYQAILDGSELGDRAFRELAAGGTLEVREVLDAILNQADRLQEEFSTITPTIGQGITRINNSLQRTIGLLSQATGAGVAFSRFLFEVSDTIDELGTIARGGSTVLTESQRTNRSFGIPEETLRVSAETVGEALTEVILRELQYYIVPSAIRILANLPVVLMSYTIDAFAAAIPEIISVGRLIIEELVDVLINTLAAQSEFLKRFLGATVSDDASRAPAIQAALSDYTTLLRESSLERVKEGFDGISNSITTTRKNISELAEIAATGGNLDQLRGDVETATEAIKVLESQIEAQIRLVDQFYTSLSRLQSGSASFQTINTLIESGFGGENRGPESLDQYIATMDRLRGLGMDVPEVLGLNERGIELLREYELILAEITRQERIEQLSDAVANTLVDGFAAAVTGARSLEDALRSVAESLIRIALQASVLGPLQSGIANLIAPALGGAVAGAPAASARGNVFGASGNIVPFAKGGILSGPAFFGLPDGRTGLGGEAGPEAIMPLGRDSQGRLGVRGSGDGGTMNITLVIPNARDPAEFRRSERQIRRSLATITGRR